MKDFITKKDKYFMDYGDAILTEFRKMKYGISPCCHKDDLDLISIRYELAKWQTSGDFSTIAQAKTNCKTWVLKNNCLEDYEGICYININVNNNDNIAKSYHVFPAQTVWTLTYDLKFTPNVTTTDEDGQEISGTVVYLNSTTVQITFSSPVSGWAYLS